MRKIAKWPIIAGLAMVGALILAVGAYAYFTASGSGNGSASVGTSTNFTVALGTATGGPLYPGSNTEVLPLTITNTGTGTQQVTSVTPSVAADASGNALDSTTGNAITGCKASWFSVSDDASNPTLPASLSNNGTYVGKIDVTMPANTTDNQNACQGAAPRITVTVN